MYVYIYIYVFRRSFGYRYGVLFWSELIGKVGPWISLYVYLFSFYFRFVPCFPPCFLGSFCDLFSGRRGVMTVERIFWAWLPPTTVA